jgi:aminoglycoside 6'-N-acetyltransferase I
MTGLHVELLLTTEADAQSILSFYPPYLHAIASYEHRPPNRHGLPTADDGIRGWDELLLGQATWWKKPGVLFPYLIRVNDSPAGFNLIASGPYVPSPGVDFVVHEFFLADAWRGTGVAAEAARQGIGRHRGAWEVATWPTAPRSIAFWRKALPTCTEGAVHEAEEDHPWGRRVVFRFDNGLA